MDWDSRSIFGKKTSGPHWFRIKVGVSDRVTYQEGCKQEESDGVTTGLHVQESRGRIEVVSKQRGT